MSVKRNKSSREDISKIASKLAKLGWQKLTPEEKSAKGKWAADMRWSKKRQNKS